MRWATPTPNEQTLEDGLADLVAYDAHIKRLMPSLPAGLLRLVDGRDPGWVRLHDAVVVGWDRRGPEELVVRMLAQEPTMTDPGGVEWVRLSFTGSVEDFGTEPRRLLTEPLEILGHELDVADDGRFELRLALSEYGPGWQAVSVVRFSSVEVETGPAPRTAPRWIFEQRRPPQSVAARLVALLRQAAREVDARIRS
jgi:hypothetical protein